ncbi:hypothetical protein [Flavobacterium sp.]|uniref:hypothetical protein n=1 Tax=Flavobacterium sp. TaxID=239 RepID=UPI003F6951F6
MALNNFEKQVQQKLSNREIKPSVNSWDRLDAMLSIEEKPKKEKGFFWLNTAASFIILASIGYYFYNQNLTIQPTHDESIIVDENSEFRIQNSENNQKNMYVLEEKQETRNKKQDVLVENNNLIKKSQNQSTINNQQSTIVNQGVSNINPSQENSNNTNSEIINHQATVKYRYISPKELLAQVENTYTPNQPVVTKSNSKIKVDANVLLSNAENELNQTFRANVIKKLNKNYQELATAIANRNYEE